MSITHIITDIEGTTSSIEFVHQVMFPFAAKALPDFVRANALEPNVRAELDIVAHEVGIAKDQLDTIIQTLLLWITEDRKHTALKNLQGMIWKTAFERGEFRSHIFADAALMLREWHVLGYALYVYSSGSVEAQQLYFAHTEMGNLRPLFKGFFDTTSGAKREVQSYTNILQSIGVDPIHCVFLSDIEAEIAAASSAGLRTVHVVRDGELPAAVNNLHHQVVRNFAQIVLT
jgi:enolase-phosphatase E1